MSDMNNDLEHMVQIGIDNALKELHTMAPGVIKTFNAANQTADIQLTIKRKFKDSLQNMPLMENVPIRFMKFGNYAITGDLNPGDHVMVIFAERCTDHWLFEGGIQDAGDTRKHALEDAYAMPFLYPQTEKISSFDNNSLQIRTLDGSILLAVENNQVRIKGNLIVEGDIEADNVTAETEVTAGTIGLTTHLTPGAGLMAGTTPVTGTTSVPPVPGV